MANQSMELWHIFTLPDGTSSMKQIPFTLTEQATGGWTSPQLKGKGSVIKRLPRDMKERWHTAPRRQLGVTFWGEGQIETGDGQKLVVRPGVVTLLEDLTGKGHLTRGYGAGDRLVCFVAIDDDVQIA